MVSSVNNPAAADLSGKVAFDANSLNSLKQAAKENSPEAIKGVAKQFESIFMNMMLKSMREATTQDSPFDNEQSRTFISMLDQQLSQTLANKGLGLADVLARQLSKTGYNQNQDMLNAVSPEKEAAGAASPASAKEILGELGQQFGSMAEQAMSRIKTFASEELNAAGSTLKGLASDFQNKMSAHAEAASQATGVPAHLMLGQAALETGWGKREIKGLDGSDSHNLFGIKATGNWDGKVVEAVTTEYINGVKQKRIEKFRAYDSYAESFKDFAKLISNNPRYENVMANLGNINGYANAMQSAGYATDPQYASKLASVIKKVVES